MFEQIQAIIDISDYEATEDDYAPARVFAEAEGHNPLSTLRHRFKGEAGHDISIREIKRFMDFLCEYGAATKVSFPDGARYEHRHIGEHHDHLICSKCNKVEEFRVDEIEELQRTVAKRCGFSLYRHVLDLYGICDDCRQADTTKLAFTDLLEGDTLVVSRIDGGRREVRHLADMGISEGVAVTLVRKKPMPLVSVGNVRFAIDHGLADKIYGVPARGPGQ